MTGTRLQELLRARSVRIATGFLDLGAAPRGPFGTRRPYAPNPRTVFAFPERRFWTVRPPREAGDVWILRVASFPAQDANACAAGALANTSKRINSGGEGADRAPNPSLNAIKSGRRQKYRRSIRPRYRRYTEPGNSGLRNPRGRTTYTESNSRRQARRGYILAEGSRIPDGLRRG